MKQPINILMHSHNASSYIKLLSSYYELDIKYYNKKKFPVKNWNPHILLLNNTQGYLSPEYLGFKEIDFYKKLKLSYDIDSDVLDSDVINIYKNKCLIIGIGRTSHLINNKLGFYILPMVNNYENSVIKCAGINNKTDEIDFERSFTFNATSQNNQLMHPYTNNSRFKLIAWSTYYNSDNYLDYDGNPIKMSKNYLEPQIVYFSNNNSLCFQSDFGLETIDTSFGRYTLNLINDYLKI